MQGDRRFRAAFPSKRLQDASTMELDRARLLPSLVLWLALRQDALAVKDSSPTAEQRLRVAASVGRWAGDWPLAVSLTKPILESWEVIAALQADPRYLATAYPALFARQLSMAGEKYQVAPEILYGVLRNESLFSPDALSSAGALGLFQFMPETFATLDSRWHLLQASGAGSREAFLLEPERSIDLAALWFGRELLPRNQGDVLLAVLEHHAGRPNLIGWMSDWKTQGRLGDVEFMVETAGMSETRIFVRAEGSIAALDLVRAPQPYRISGLP